MVQDTGEVIRTNMETTQIKTYLLGNLSAELSATLEERLLSDDDFFELLQAEEDELIDQYLANDLTPIERQQFEQHFLAAPERRERLSFAQTLQQEFAKTSVPDATPARTNPATFTPAPTPWWRTWWSSPWAYATAAVLIAVIGWGLWRNNTPTVASFTLVPNVVRSSAQTNVVTVPPGASHVKLQLELEKVESGLYQASLRDESGNERRFESLSPLQQQLVLEIPTAQLAPGTYHIKLVATTNSIPVEEYTFRVTR
jgi:hypothetical protein